MKLVQMDLNQYQQLFQLYEHSIPIIYSAIEGQYPCHFYVDDLDHPNFGLLFTQFDFNYFGYINLDMVDKIEIQKTIREHIIEFEIKECIMFVPTEESEQIIQSIFESFYGVVDVRYSFKLDFEQFTALAKQVVTDNVHLEYCKDDHALIEFPKCELFIDHMLISFAKAFMLGKSNAEIDVFTNENHRRKGYAKLCSIKLISNLLNHKIIPNWTAWEHKESSHQLANQLGFKLDKKINAFVWVDEFGEL